MTISKPSPKSLLALSLLFASVSMLLAINLKLEPSLKRLSLAWLMASTEKDMESTSISL